MPQAVSPPEGVAIERNPCPLGCHATDATIIVGRDRINGVPGEFTVVRCNGCGLMRTNPRPTKETIGAYYPEHYAPFSASADRRASGKNRRIRNVLRRWTGRDMRRLPRRLPGARLIEIGSAAGDFLEHVLQQGWSAEGIEPSDVAAGRARAKGLSVRTGTVDTVVIAERSADVVAAWMVLEHLHDPLDALRRIARWCKPDGYLVGSVPLQGRLFLRVFGDCSYDLQLPTHLYHFSVRTLRSLLAAGGWRLERIRWQPNPNTLLWSLEFAASDRGLSRLARAVSWFRTARAATVPRVVFGWFLGITRTSGRVEFWAQRASSGA
jgi:SAM-dependent methyltransferase